MLRTVQGHLSLDSTRAGRRRLPWHVLLTCVVTVERTQINTNQWFRAPESTSLPLLIPSASDL